MSADKQTKALNRSHDRRTIKNQLVIWRLYNPNDQWLVQQKPSGWRKQRAMNCSCKTCRGWAVNAKRFRYNLQLEKQGMCDKFHTAKSFAQVKMKKIDWDLFVKEEDWI